LRDDVHVAITYRGGNALDLDEVIDLYIASTLGERRPAGDRGRMAAMLEHANLVITAWDDSGESPVLAGIARSMTDFRYVTYLADLAVRASHQRLGIGVELIRRTRLAAPEAMIVLLAAPKAVDYYPHVGFARHPSAWILRAEDRLLSPEGSS
jgi:GNAT superfamily N-acetyltransferase